jgi:anti-sigma B factor antagonist
MTQCVRLGEHHEYELRAYDAEVRMQSKMDMEELVDIEQVNNALVVKPRFRRLDAAVAPAFRDHIVPRLRDRRVVVFALGNIQSMDNSGLGSLVSLLKMLPAGGVVRLAEVSTALEKVLMQTHLDNVLPVFPTVALAANGVFGQPSRVDRNGPRRERAATNE